MLLAAVPPGSCFSATLVILVLPLHLFGRLSKKRWNQGPRESKPPAWVTQRKWGVGLYPTISHGLKPDTPTPPILELCLSFLSTLI